MSNPDACTSQNPDRGDGGIASRVKGGGIVESLHRHRDGRWSRRLWAGNNRGPSKPMDPMDAAQWLRKEGLNGLLFRYFPDLCDCEDSTFSDPPNVFVGNFPKGSKGGRGNWANSPRAKDEAA